MGSVQKPWVDGPCKLIDPSITGDRADKRATGAARVAAEMALVHNALFRGLNAVILQCVNVDERGSEKDKTDFVRFARQWLLFIEGHHGLEENGLFPDINRLSGVPDYMDASVGEHQAFHDGMHEYGEYLDRVIAGGEKYNGKKFKAIIEGFRPALETHLSNEIQTLLGLSQFEDKVDWHKWFDETVAKYSEKLLNTPGYKSDMIPLAMINHHRKYADGVWAHFPPVPWFIHLMLRWLYVPTHKDWWRFAGCDANSNPRELPFA